MSCFDVDKANGVATLTLFRGKVNALNRAVVDELRGHLEALESDAQTRAVVLTGRGKFFSFGFDIPEFLTYSRKDFKEFLTAFSDLYTYAFLYPKPFVAALNGHTIAGGCMLSLACDCRVMAKGKSKISLNEISFGSTVVAGSTEMLRFAVGSANASTILYSGAMYSPEEAKGLGMVEEIVEEDQLLERARQLAFEMGAKNPPAFASVKALLRKPIAQEMMRREDASVEDFLDIWYSEATRANLKEIKIN